MDPNLQHEDLLIKLRAKLNAEKVRLWEPPYYQADSGVSQELQDLAIDLADKLSKDYETIMSSLLELQSHSIDRSKANAAFEETGVATVRVRATGPQGPRSINVQKRLDVPGTDLIASVAAALDVPDARVKLIFNGKVIKATPSIEEQGIKNGVQIMALVMTESPDTLKKEEQMYLEMQSTRDDATLLSEYVDECDDEDEEYIKLEDQSGRCVELPPTERRSLLVGLALHERGRTAMRQHEYSLALLLLLEADKQLSECSSSLLNQVDNYAVLQLDISWCYVCLRALRHAADAARRLRMAEDAFKAAYGDTRQRLRAVKGENANERVLFMRLYLLQGIVAYHQNHRAEARSLLDRAEVELEALRVDENSVLALMELGWTRGESRAGLRAVGGDVDVAHHYLEEKRFERELTREKYRAIKQQRALGVCLDGQPVSPSMVTVLSRAGFPRRIAIRALRNTNNNAGDAVRLIQEHRDLLISSDDDSCDDDSPNSDDALVEPDDGLVTELVSMGYAVEQTRLALKMARNDATAAVEMLLAGDGNVTEEAKPSTSAGGSSMRKGKKQEKRRKKKERDEALRRLTSSIQTDSEDHLDTSLTNEEEFLAQYKSLL